MPVKRQQVAGIGQVSFYKRSGVRSLRLTVTPAGTVRVTLPRWVPYKTAVEFVHNSRQWITLQRPAAPNKLAPDDQIGKVHRLVFVSSSGVKPSGRIRGGDIRISYPPGMSWEDDDVQSLARTAGIRALRRQAQRLLPERVRQLAERHDFHYRSVSVKQLKSRWGSCNHRQELVFSLYLMQLPWDLIDYVIMHELQHTTILRHGPEFWAAMGRHTPAVSELRRRIRGELPVLRPAAATLPEDAQGHRQVTIAGVNRLRLN